MHGYGEKLPFEDNSFDVVYSVSVMEHIASGNDLIVISEMLRVLKVGGSVDSYNWCYAKRWNELQKIYLSFLLQIHYLLFFDFLGHYENIDEKENRSLLSSLDSLTWEQIHKFWIDSKKFDQREEEQREYLAVGFFIDKGQDFVLDEDKNSTIFTRSKCTYWSGFESLSRRGNCKRKRDDSKRKVIQQLLQIRNNFETNFLCKNIKETRIIKMIKKLLKKHEL